jgi:hypothetical protein
MPDHSAYPVQFRPDRDKVRLNNPARPTAKSEIVVGKEPPEGKVRHEGPVMAWSVVQSSRKKPEDTLFAVRTER